MTFVRVLSVCAGLAIASATMLASTTQGHAFDQQGAVTPIVPQKAPAASKAATPATPAGKLSTELNVPSSPVATEDGTEVYIPGLGKLGVLPKMDFGLELLYGASDAKFNQNQQLNVDPDNTNDDLRVRGTVKHNF